MPLRKRRDIRALSSATGGVETLDATRLAVQTFVDRGALQKTRLR